jgi:hypothetical protein
MEKIRIEIKDKPERVALTAAAVHRGIQQLNKLTGEYRFGLKDCLKLTRLKEQLEPVGKAIQEAFNNLLAKYGASNSEELPPEGLSEFSELLSTRFNEEGEDSPQIEFERVKITVSDDDEQRIVPGIIADVAPFVIFREEG